MGYILKASKNLKRIKAAIINPGWGGKNKRPTSIPEKSSITISLGSFLAKLISAILEETKAKTTAPNVKRKKLILLLKSKKTPIPKIEAKVPPKKGAYPMPKSVATTNHILSCNDTFLIIV